MTNRRGLTRYFSEWRKVIHVRLECSGEEGGGGVCMLSLSGDGPLNKQELSGHKRYHQGTSSFVAQNKVVASLIYYKLVANYCP